MNIFFDKISYVFCSSDGVGRVSDDEEGPIVPDEDKPIGPKRRLDNKPPLK